MKENNLKIVKYEEDNKSIEVKVSYDDSTIWLNRNQLAILFNKDVTTIGRHLKSVLKNINQNDSVVAKFALTAADGKKYIVDHYNMNIIEMVGYRINPDVTIKFKKWVDLIISVAYLKKEDNEAINYELFTFNNGNFSLDIRVSPVENTVWLSQNDLAVLFETTVPNISVHIRNIFKDEELDSSVVKFFLITASDGKSYKTSYYNMDMVISVGFRVNSKRGIAFRRWANSILNKYLSNGYVIDNKKCIACEANYHSLQKDVNELRNDFYEYVDNSLPDEVLFSEGDYLRAYNVIRKIFFFAKEELIIVDKYADNSLINMLDKISVSVTIVVEGDSYLNNVELPTNIKIINATYLHDRFIICDNTVFSIGTSFNSIGKSPFCIYRYKYLTKELVLDHIKELC